MNYYTIDKSNHKLIYMQGTTKHFARIFEISQVERFRKMWDSNYFPFNSHTFYEFKWVGYTSPEHIEATLNYMKSLPPKQYVKCEYTKISPGNLGTIHFTLEDPNGFINLADCEFSKNHLKIYKQNVKFQDSDLEAEYNTFMRKLDECWNNITVGNSYYDYYSVRSFKRRLLAKDK